MCSLFFRLHVGVAKPCAICAGSPFLPIIHTSAKYFLNVFIFRLLLCVICSFLLRCGGFLDLTCLGLT